MKKRYWILTFFFLFFGTGIFFTIQKFTPQIHREVKLQLEALKTNPIVDIEWDHVQIHPFLLKASVENVQVVSKNQEYKARAQKIFFKINILESLIQRRIMSNAHIISPHLKAKQSSSWQSWDETDSTPFWSALSSLPIYKVYLKKGSLNFKNPSFHIISKDIDLYFKNSFKSLDIEIAFSQKFDEKFFHIQSDLHITPLSMNISKVHVKTGQTDMFSNMRIQMSEQNKVESIVVEFDGDSSVQDVQSVLTFLNIEQPFIATEGLFNIKTQITYSHKQPLQSSFKFYANQLLIRDIPIEQLKIHGNIQNQKLDILMFHLNQKGGTLFTENTQIILDRELSFKSKIYSHIKDWNLIEDIFNFKSGVQFQAPLELDCHGSLQNIQVNCQASGSFKNILMAHKNSKSLIRIPKIQGSLNWSVNQKDYLFEGRIFSQNKSNITLKGYVKNHQRGEVILGGSFDLGDVQSVLNKSVQGLLEFSKTKWKIGKAKTLTSKIKINDLYFNDSYLGNSRFNLSINPKAIRFSDIAGSLNKSKYKMQVELLSIKDKMALNLKSKISPAHLEDVSKIIHLKSQDQIKLSGVGSIQLDLSSPDISGRQWNYNITSSFRDFIIQGESFKKLIFNTSSKDGVINFDKVVAEKIKGSIEMTGSLDANQKLSAHLKGKELMVERSEWLNQFINPFFSGILNFDCQLSQSLRSPQANIKGTLKSAFFGNAPLEDSQFTLQMNSNQISGSGNFFNNRFQVKDFKLNQASQNVSIQFNSKDFNFIPFLPFSNPLLKIQSQLTGQASLHFPLKRPKYVSGFLNIQDLSMSRGKEIFKSTHPFYITFNRGKGDLRESSIRFKNNQEDLVLKKLSNNEHQLSGNWPIGFLSLLFSRIEDLQGQAHIQVKFNKKWQPRGNIKIRNGLLRFNRYVDDLRSLSMDIELNSNKADIQNFNAQVSSGEISGNGQIHYHPKDGLGVQLQSQFSQMTFYKDEDIRFKGYGELFLSGTSPIYTLEGRLYIQEGFIKTSFDKPRSESPNLSIFNLKKKNQFLLDVLLTLDRPLVIENETMAALINGAIHIQGPSVRPLISGDLSVAQGGKFYFRDYEFEILQGTIRYNRNTFDKLDLNVVAQTDLNEIQYVQNAQRSQQYKVRAEIQNNQAGFNLKLSSQPPLSESEILSMMTLGLKNIGLKGNPDKLRDVALSSYSGIGYALFRDLVGREISEILGVRFAMNTFLDTDQNKILNKIWLHKKWSQNLFTSVSTFVENTNRSLSVEYNLTPKISLLGMWHSVDPTEKKSEDESDVLSLDVEYKWDF